MSNINSATKAIRKKLSFGDYSNEKQEPKQEAKQPEPLNVEAQPKAEKPQQPQRQQTRRPVYQQVRKQQPTHYEPEPEPQPTPEPEAIEPEPQHEKSKKIKVTYYLSIEDNDALTDIFIKRLQQRNKTDKSALIAEAIGLLYEKEMRE